MKILLALAAWLTVAAGVFLIIEHIGGIIGSFYHPNAPDSPRLGYQAAVTFWATIGAALLALRFTLSGAATSARISDSSSLYSGSPVWPQQPTSPLFRRPRSIPAACRLRCLQGSKRIYDGKPYRPREILGGIDRLLPRFPFVELQPGAERCVHSMATLSKRAITDDFDAHYSLDQIASIPGPATAYFRFQPDRMRRIDGDGWTAFTDYAREDRRYHMIVDRTNTLTLFAKCFQGCELLSRTPAGTLRFNPAGGPEFEPERWRTAERTLLELVSDWRVERVDR